MPKFAKKLAIQFQENAQTDGRIEGLKGGPTSYFIGPIRLPLGVQLV